MKFMLARPVLLPIFLSFKYICNGVLKEDYDKPDDDLIFESEGTNSSTNPLLYGCRQLQPDSC